MNVGESAGAVIAELSRRYMEMTSYQDEGIVLQALDPSSEPIEMRFTSHFRRPGLFRFAFASPHPFPPLAHIVTEHVCGADKGGAYSWTKAHDEEAELEDEESLAMAVAGATGISGGSAHTIGRLLIPEVGGFSLGDLSGAIVAREETFEDANCFVVEAPHPIGGKVEVWIDRGSFILRKMRTALGRFPPSEEIRRNISVNPKLDDSIFERPKV